MLPRHHEIIVEINRRFQREVLTAYPQQPERAKEMAIIDEAEPPNVHMARLAVVGRTPSMGGCASHAIAQVTGDEVVCRTLSRPLNKTNGVTLVVGSGNPPGSVATELVGEQWVTDLDGFGNSNRTSMTRVSSNASWRSRMNTSEPSAPLSKRRLVFGSIPPRFRCVNRGCTNTRSTCCTSSTCIFGPKTGKTSSQGVYLRSEGRTGLPQGQDHLSDPRRGGRGQCRP